MPNLASSKIPIRRIRPTDSGESPHPQSHCKVHNTELSVIAPPARSNCHVRRCYPWFRNQVAAIPAIRYYATHVLTSVHHGHGVLLLPVSSCVDAWRNEELTGFYHFSTSKTHRRNRAGGFSICALRSSRSKTAKTTKGQTIENSHRFDRRTTRPADSDVAGASHSTRRVFPEHYARPGAGGPREWPFRAGSGIRHQSWMENV